MSLGRIATEQANTSQIAIHLDTQVLLHEVNAPTAVVKLTSSNIGSTYRYQGLGTGPKVGSEPPSDVECC